MISAWWLLIIVPAAAWFGYGISSMLNISSQTDMCADCIFNKTEKDRESK